MPLFYNACIKAAVSSLPVSLDTQFPAQSRTSTQTRDRPHFSCRCWAETPLHILLIVNNSSVLNTSIVRFGQVPCKFENILPLQPNLCSQVVGAGVELLMQWLLKSKGNFPGSTLRHPLKHSHPLALLSSLMIEAEPLPCGSMFGTQNAFPQRKSSSRPKIVFLGLKKLILEVWLPKIS